LSRASAVFLSADQEATWMGDKPGKPGTDSEMVLYERKSLQIECLLNIY